MNTSPRITVKNFYAILNNTRKISIFFFMEYKLKCWI